MQTIQSPIYCEYLFTIIQSILSHESKNHRFFFPDDTLFRNQSQMNFFSTIFITIIIAIIKLDNAITVLKLFLVNWFVIVFASTWHVIVLLRGERLVFNFFEHLIKISPMPKRRQQMACMKSDLVSKKRRNNS